MEKKKILVLAPILTLPDDLVPFLSMLDFLKSDYDVETIDPLLEYSCLDNNQYYQNWQKTLAKIMHQYDAFIGFSFGAVILQQCFILFDGTTTKKLMLLFSAPSFADNALREKLSRVLYLAQHRQLNSAHRLKMQYVYHPGKAPPSNAPTSRDYTLIGCRRLVEGITRLLTTDSRTPLKTYHVKYHHFIGEHSYLVNSRNVIPGRSGTILTVPGASMRVLQDNPAYCYKKIKEILR